MTNFPIFISFCVDWTSMAVDKVLCTSRLTGWPRMIEQKKILVQLGQAAFIFQPKYVSLVMLKKYGFFLSS